MADHLPPVDLTEHFRKQSRDAANASIMTLRTELNTLHKTMLATADQPNPTNHKAAWEAATILAGNAIAVAAYMKELYEVMKETE